MAEATEPPSVNAADDYDSSRKSKFRFKSKRSRSPTSADDRYRSSKRRGHGSDNESSEKRRHRAHRHHHGSKRRKTEHRGPTDDPAQHDDTFDNVTYNAQFRDPEAAFRESLFDAMADDEGAAYWEGVYGQPIHTYSDTRPGPDGELERMDDDEYAEYVRAKMWEKTHQHLVEERAKIEEKKARERENRKGTEKMEREKADWERRVQESLKKGEQRKAKKRWKESWERYNAGWEKLKAYNPASSDGDEGGTEVRNAIPWPVESGRRRDVSKEEVELFVDNALPSDTDRTAWLKRARVEWHPDKVMQRLGTENADGTIIKSVTSVFQIVDRMWSETRGNG